MEFKYDKVANALYIRFSSEKVVNSDEIAHGIILDYGKNDNVIGVEILNFTDRKLNLNDLVQMNVEELISRLAQYSLIITKEIILSTLKALKDELKTRYKVNQIGLFGSYVSDSQEESSDIDILVEFNEDASLFDLVRLSRYLEEIFGKKVEVVSKASLKKEIKQYILDEVVYV
ncbi:MAG: DUF2283 domain-containing protein [Promethearchaeota archaeon]|nr:MAG: DUF2283 domain-containing protein [Candidatus Lokiarchaeota archaeon]